MGLFDIKPPRKSSKKLNNSFGLKPSKPKPVNPFKYPKPFKPIKPVKPNFRMTNLIFGYDRPKPARKVKGKLGLNWPRSTPHSGMKDKNMNWYQAKFKYPKLKPMGDKDKDGVKNMFDCKPLNQKKQEVFLIKRENLGETQLGGISTQDIPGDYSYQKKRYDHPISSGMSRILKTPEKKQAYSKLEKEQSLIRIKELESKYTPDELSGKKFTPKKIIRISSRHYGEDKKKRMVKRMKGFQDLSGETPKEAKITRSIIKDFKKGIKDLPKEEFKIIQHEALHHLYKDYKKGDVEKQSAYQFHKARKWIDKEYNKRPNDKNITAVMEADYVRDKDSGYDITGVGKEELAIRIATKVPEIIYGRKDTPFGRVKEKQKGKGLRIFKNEDTGQELAYTKDEFQGQSEAPEVLKMMDLNNEVQEPFEMKSTEGWSATTVHKGRPATVKRVKINKSFVSRYVDDETRKVIHPEISGVDDPESPFLKDEKYPQQQRGHKEFIEKHGEKLEELYDEYPEKDDSINENENYAQDLLDTISESEDENENENEEEDYKEPEKK